MMRIRQALIALPLVAVLALSACSSGSSSVQTVDAQQFSSVVAAAGTTVIDVRTPAEFAAGHLDGAVNIDVQGADFDAQIAALPKDGTYAVYCHSGRRSADATSRMADAGFAKVYNLDGGVQAWADAGGQLTTS